MMTDEDDVIVQGVYEPMTVGDLARELSKYSPAMKITVETYHSGTFDIVDLFEEGGKVVMILD